MIQQHNQSFFLFSTEVIVYIINNMDKDTIIRFMRTSKRAYEIISPEIKNLSFILDDIVILRNAYRPSTIFIKMDTKDDRFNIEYFNDIFTLSIETMSINNNVPLMFTNYINNVHDYILELDSFDPESILTSIYISEFFLLFRKEYTDIDNLEKLYNIMPDTIIIRGKEYNICIESIDMIDVYNNYKKYYYDKMIILFHLVNEPCPYMYNKKDNIHIETMPIKNYMKKMIDTAYELTGHNN